MGRRALKKVDPAINLDGYLFRFDDLPQPWDAAELFGRAAPLVIEVGSGKGLFMTTASTESPQHNHFGIEVRHKYATFAAAQLARHGLTNGKMLAGDALQLFAERLPDSSVDQVHVYFPDPWWKTRHRKRRVMNEAFLQDIQRVLIDQGELHFWTDVEEYFQSTLKLIAQTTKFQGPLEVSARQPEHDLDYRTHFERRMRRHDLPIYRSLFVKPATSQPGSSAE